MNDRMSDMDALVELAARALCIDAKHEGNQRFDDWHKEQARAALLAVGLPALLERVEAVEREADEAIQQATNWSEDAAVLERDRDALAAKVAAASKLADWYDAQPNWREWRIGASIRTALDASETP